jgi:hypothetical protein
MHNPRPMGEVGHEALRVTWSGTLSSASSRDYGILRLDFFRAAKKQIPDKEQISIIARAARAA